MKYEDLRRVLSRLGISDLGQPNSAGWAHTSCPFAASRHRGGIDKSRGFALKVEERGVSAFTCPACKSHGRIEQLVRELGVMRNHDYSVLLQEVSQIELYGTMMVPRWEERSQNAFSETLPPPLNKFAFDPEEIFEDVRQHPDAVQYLQRRFVSYEAVKTAGVRFDPDKKRLVFPVYDDKHNLYGFTGRTIKPKEELEYTKADGQRVVIPKVLDYANLPKRLLILGEHRWQRGRPTVIVEGLFAYLRFLTEGVEQHANVGALQGSEATPGKLAILRKWGNPCYLILDPDEAGQAGIFGRWKEVGKDRDTGEPILRQDVTTGLLWGLIDHVPVYVPQYPDGVDDPDDLSLAQILDMCTACPPSMKPKVKKNFTENRRY